MKLRPLTVADLPAVATLHRAAFPHAAISRLGQAAARRYYESLLAGPHEAAGLGAFENGRMVGFSFVGMRHIAEVEFVRQHAWFLMWRLATDPWLMCERFILERMVSGLRMLLPATRSPVVATPSCPAGGRSFGIQFLAVDPRCQARGVGRRLLAASEEVARRRGCVEIHLSVDGDNSRAIGFYERMGWRKRSRDGIWQGVMFKHLTPEEKAKVAPAAT